MARWYLRTQCWRQEIERSASQTSYDGGSPISPEFEFESRRCMVNIQLSRLYALLGKQKQCAATRQVSRGKQGGGGEGSRGGESNGLVAGESSALTSVLALLLPNRHTWVAVHPSPGDGPSAMPLPGCHRRASHAATSAGSLASAAAASTCAACPLVATSLPFPRSPTMPSRSKKCSTSSAAMQPARGSVWRGGEHAVFLGVEVGRRQRHHE